MSSYIIASSKPWNKDLSSELKKITGQSFITLSDPKDLSIDSLEKLNPRYIFFPHWSSIISPEVYEKFECVIFHMTDLPFGRGGSPLQNLILRGINETKVSALRCVREIDAGPIYLKYTLSLFGTAEEIYIRTSKLIQDMIVEIVKKNPEPTQQQGNPVIFTRKDEEAGNLLGISSLEKMFDVIRMLDAEGYPKAHICVGDIRFEFSRASLKVNELTTDVKITINK